MTLIMATATVIVLAIGNTEGASVLAKLTVALAIIDSAYVLRTASMLIGLRPFERK